MIVEVVACLFFDFKFEHKFCKFTGSFSKHKVEGSFEVEGWFEVWQVIIEVAFSSPFLFLFKWMLPSCCEGKGLFSTSCVFPIYSK